MTTYRELVERTLAVRHASLELGLAKAREQEVFVGVVAEKLAAFKIDYVIKMDRYFNVYFCVEDAESFRAARRALRRFDIAIDTYCNKQCLHVHSVRNHERGVDVTVVLGSDI